MAAPASGSTISAVASATRLTLDDLFRQASARIDRLTPGEVRAEMAAGAVLVDIRARDNRVRDGIVPGSLHIPRTVLEWRADPDSPSRNAHVGGLEGRVILICDQGYSSVLAAATLRDLGFSRAADLIGGFEAWRAAGLPVTPCPRRRPSGLEGSGRPASHE